MFTKYLNKARNLRRPEPQIDPRERLQALIRVRQRNFEVTEENVEAGIESHDALDRARADVVAAHKALDDFDAEREQAAATADHRASRGEALIAEAKRADAEIEAAVANLETALKNAQPIIDEIERSFFTGYSYVEPFRNTPIVERLKHWSRGVNVHHGGLLHETGRFDERLSEYRRLLQPPVELTIYRPTPEQIEASRRERDKRRRLGLENSRIRSRFVEGVGVEVVTRAENQAV